MIVCRSFCHRLHYSRDPAISRRSTLQKDVPPPSGSLLPVAIPVSGRTSDSQKCLSASELHLRLARCSASHAISTYVDRFYGVVAIRVTNHDDNPSFF